MVVSACCRWAGGEASIWDVKAGKDLAQTPSKQASWAEEIRAKKIAKAQFESPLVSGYRLLPEFTPGRAFVWGTILSVWGVAVATTVVSKSYGITAVRRAINCVNTFFIFALGKTEAVLNGLDYRKMRPRRSGAWVSRLRRR
jgi:hypothetical protein